MKAPERLETEHNIADFVCDETVLTHWIKSRARKNQLLGASRTFVICAANTNRVIGYYCLATGSVEHHIAPGGLRRNMPDPLPVIILGRLAIDSAWKGQGLGGDLLRDAVLRCRRVANEIGAVAILVHAISDEAVAFYRYFGFQPAPFQDHTLFLPL